MPPTGRSTGGGNRRVLAAVGAGVLLLVLVVGAFALSGGDDGGTATTTTGGTTAPKTTEAVPAGYDAQVREDWTERCSAGGGGVAFCQCSFEQMSAEIPFQEFRRATELFDTSLDQYPRSFQDIFDQCRIDNGD